MYPSHFILICAILYIVIHAICCHYQSHSSIFSFVGCYLLRSSSKDCGPNKGWPYAMINTLGMCFSLLPLRYMVSAAYINMSMFFSINVPI